MECGSRYIGSLFLFLNPCALSLFRREVYEDSARPFGLCYSCTFQSGRDFNRLLCARWSHVGFQASFPHLPLTSIVSRIWNTSDGQCLKTLAEGHNAIWYVHDLAFSLSTFMVRQANKCNFHLIPNTSSPQLMTTRFVFGIISLLDV